MGKIPTRVHRSLLYPNFHLIASAYQQGVQQHILYITTLCVHVHTSDECVYSASLFFLLWLLQLRGAMGKLILTAGNDRAARLAIQGTLCSVRNRRRT